ncbi:kelch-like protein 8 isoform X4 [Manis javanica]|uniref:kelch-like protein 8 isoform X4 n=1 Tax=Manis javanica TaxID=9974 RepID=UPI00187A4979|nr:kelch-like protein 8 isoform X5 [Manis javanica]
MASEPMNAKQARNHFTKGKRPQYQQAKTRSPVCDGDGEDSFIFEANEAWKDFHGSLLQFYENGELCDITLKVGSKLIPCHKLVLACVIPYFKAMFLSEMAEAKQTLIEIRDFDGDAIEDLVRLPLLPVDFLMGVVAKEQIVKQNLKCRDLLDEARNYHLHLSSRAVPDFEYSIRTTPRKHTAGVLFCVGGRGGSGDPFRSIECYSINKNSWFFGPEMNSRRRHVGVISVEGKVYAVGGHDGNEHLGSMEMFDPLTNKWMMKASMNTKRRGIALASLGGPIYAIGGLDDNTCFNDVERYDIESDQWSTVAPMNTPRGGVGSVALANHVYAVGGNDGVASLSSVERYDPHLDKWIEVKEMGQRRAGNGISELHGCLYVVGGFDDNSPLNSVERYDPRSNKWDYVAALTTPRGGVGIATVMGKIFAVGGHNGNAYLNTVEAFDPVLNRWELVGSVSHCRAGAGVAVCACLTSQIRDVGHGSSNVVDCM